MKSLSSQFEGLGARESFNASVRHIKTVISAIERVQDKENLADIVGELSDEKSLAKEDALPFVSMILGDKFKYRAVSSNLFSVAQDLGAIAAELKSWNGVDLVAVYHHPDLGPIVVNPKSQASLARIDRLSRSELLVVWAGDFAKPADDPSFMQAASAVVDLFSGKKVKPKADFLKGDCAYKEAARKGEKAVKKEKASAKAVAPMAPAKRGRPAKAAVAAPEMAAAPAKPVEELKPAVQAERAVKPGSHMTPMYSVPVTNELFHNGNVEAWKRIIASYNAKFPALQVLVYYDGERIADINALFKWGKVKHGSTIQFAVAGDEITGVAKLQRYLAQGASPQFEAFLHGPVNAVLPLF
jgi:hypothetical protein